MNTKDSSAVEILKHGRLTLVRDTEGREFYVPAARVVQTSAGFTLAADKPAKRMKIDDAFGEAEDIVGGASTFAKADEPDA